MLEDILLYNITLIFVQFMLWYFIFLSNGPFISLCFLLVSFALITSQSETLEHMIVLSR